jgi:hypothetical protein
MDNPGINRETPIRVPASTTLNTVEGVLAQAQGRFWEGSVNIVADNETKIFNVFEFTETITILDQWAIITAIADLTNCTNVYADVWDGTNAVPLTLDGMTLSGVPVGSFFTKDKLAADTYSLNDASQVRVSEVLDSKKVGRPFTITAKNGVTNYIRFHVTTNTTLDFTMFLHFNYLLLNGATLT